MTRNRVSLLASPMDRRSFLKGGLGVLGAAALGGLLAGCATKTAAPVSAPAAGGTAPTGPAITFSGDLRLGWMKNAQFAGVFMADDNGYYREEGIELKIEPGGAGIDPIPLVSSGSEEIGIANSGASLMLARSRGVPVKVFASMLQKHPNGFLSLKEKNITRPEDFVGKRLGQQPENNPYTQAVLKKFNIPATQVQISNVGYDATSLLADQIDIYTAWSISQPIAVQKAGKDYNFLFLSDLGFRFYAMCYFTSENFLARPEGKDVVERFLRATIKGWQYAAANPKEAVDVTVSKYGQGLNPENEMFVMEQQTPLLESDETRANVMGWMEQSVWEQGMTQLLELDLMQTRFNIGDLLYMDALNAIKRG